MNSLSQFRNAPRPTEVSLGVQERSFLPRLATHSPASTGRRKSNSRSVAKNPLVGGAGPGSALLIGLLAGWASRESSSKSGGSPGDHMGGMDQVITAVPGSVTSAKPAA